MPDIGTMEDNADNTLNCYTMTGDGQDKGTGWERNREACKVSTYVFWFGFQETAVFRNGQDDRNLA